jgi:hypothetical protein
VEPPREEHVQAVDDPGVPAADRAHLDDLTVEELDAVVFVEDADLGHGNDLEQRCASLDLPRAPAIPRRACA